MATAVSPGTSTCLVIGVASYEWVLTVGGRESDEGMGFLVSLLLFLMVVVVVTFLCYCMYNHCCCCCRSHCCCSLLFCRRCCCRHHNQQTSCCFSFFFFFLYTKDIMYYPGKKKKRTILEIRSEKNAVPRVISCSITRDQRRAKVADSRGSDLPCADRA